LVGKLTNGTIFNPKSQTLSFSTGCLTCWKRRLPLALRSISDIRRQELRAAAFRVLQREGVQGTTLEKVAEEAGASKGIVLHYFGSKAELFEHVMREANLVLRDRVNARLTRATTPMERLVAILEGNFEPDIFTPAICYAWLSLCAPAFQPDVGPAPVDALGRGRASRTSYQCAD
jgi:TetR/AcrR family transcriptional regulator, transcriptional repressor of bet genes